MHLLFEDLISLSSLINVKVKLEPVSQKTTETNVLLLLTVNFRSSSYSLVYNLRLLIILLQFQLSILLGLILLICNLVILPLLKSFVAGDDFVVVICDSVDYMLVVLVSLSDDLVQLVNLFLALVFGVLYLQLV